MLFIFNKGFIYNMLIRLFMLVFYENENLYGV
jgi:hypothetical protein